MKRRTFFMTVCGMFGAPWIPRTKQRTVPEAIWYENWKTADISPFYTGRDGRLDKSLRMKSAKIYVNQAHWLKSDRFLGEHQVTTSLHAGDNYVIFPDDVQVCLDGMLSLYPQWCDPGKPPRFNVSNVIWMVNRDYDPREA